MDAVPQWGLFEIELTSHQDYEDPFQDVTVTVGFTSPAGRTRTVEAFWDGGRTWRARFNPDGPGRWAWASTCSSATNAGLQGRAGTFSCDPPPAKGPPLRRHGPVHVAEDGRHFAHADGTAFFWLADTAWNGPLRARPDQWQTYLAARKKQGFSAIQFVSTQWRGADGKTLGQVAFDVAEGRIAHFNPEFFARLDPYVRAINEHGLLAAPVILWACTKDDPGQTLSDEQAIRFARYLVARWGGYEVVWLLGGDGDYTGPSAARWRKIGRAVFADRHDRPATMHYCGQKSFTDEFRSESWFDFMGYQSGHGVSEAELRWLVQGPPATEWRDEPVKPSVNLEPNYEAMPAYGSGEMLGAYEVRRAVCWSLLVMPPAGVTYGCNPIWIWPPKGKGKAIGHGTIDKAGLTPEWSEGLKLPGGEQMGHVRAFFEALEWTRLRPSPELLAEQPGLDDPSRFIAAARTVERREAALYLPRGGEMALADIRGFRTIRWFNPRTGKWSGSKTVQPRLQAPDEQDWLVRIEA